MLKSLLIQNYALIQRLEISFSKSFNIVTGETGAGKSIMLGALGLLQGNRADTKALFDDGAKCVVEACFEGRYPGLEALLDEAGAEAGSETILRRDISPSGKSRGFVNDTPANLDTMRRISGKLMDIHSQHETLLLGSESFQLHVLDAYAQSKHLLADYRLAFSGYKQAEKAYADLLKAHEEQQKAFDFNSFQLDELVKADLDGTDQEKLEQELELLENAGNIKNSLNQALTALGGDDFSVEQGLKTVMAALNQVAGFSQKFETLRGRTESCLIELMDIQREIEGEESSLFLDPAQAEQLKDRLDLIYSLQKKHNQDSVAGLVALRQRLQDQVDQVLGFGEQLKALAAEKEKARKQLLKAGQGLSDARKSVAGGLEEDIRQLLAGLGMPNARMLVSMNPQEPGPDGLDDVRFLFSANKGVPPQDLKNVASGGEFSRFMLCVKHLLAKKTDMPTIVFDEIDTGVSGEIAIKMGRLMKEMAQGHQIISISHLPQIAALGDAHYFVFKDDSSGRAVSRMRQLNENERLTEIAQMIGGTNPSPTAYESARELMAMR